jgi:AcrR family transcriptional regulator
MGRKSLVTLRQKEIVKAFYKVSLKEGLENASIAKVAEALEVNPSLVIHYFKSRQELLHGLIEYIIERYKLIYDPGNGNGNGHPKAKLKKVINNLFSRKWHKLFDDSVFYSGYALIFRDDTIKEHYKNLHDQLRKLLADALQEAADAKVIESDNVQQTADLVFVFVEGAYYYLSMVGDKAEYEKRLSFYEKTVLQFLKLQ